MDLILLIVALAFVVLALRTYSRSGRRSAPLAWALRLVFVIFLGVLLWRVGIGRPVVSALPIVLG